MYSKINRFILYFSIIIVFILQLTILDFIKILDWKPDISLLMVIFLSIFFGAGAGIESAFSLGLLKDIFSAGIFGVNTLTLVLTAFVAGMLSPKFFRESRVTQIFLVYIITFISMLIHYFLSSLIAPTGYISASEYLCRLIIPTSIYTSALSAVIFPILIDKFHLKEPEEFL